MLKLNSRALVIYSPAAGVTKAYSRRPKHGHPIYNNRFCNLISASHGNLTLQNVPFINIHVVDCPTKPKKHKHCCQLPLAHIIPLSGSEPSVSKTKTSKIGENMFLGWWSTVLWFWGGGWGVNLFSYATVFTSVPQLLRWPGVWERWRGAGRRNRVENGQQRVGNVLYNTVEYKWVLYGWTTQWYGCGTLFVFVTRANYCKHKRSICILIYLQSL